MLARPCLRPILDDEAITRGLADPEARILVEWLVERAEECEGDPVLLARVCRRTRGIARFVHLWCHRRERGAAVQLAAAERFDWPLPDHFNADPFELMQAILAWELERLDNEAASARAA